MSAVQVDIRVPLGRPLPELADFAVQCEQAGLSGVGVPDHHHTGRDAYLALAAMALRTSRLSLYPATSNVVTRHPLVLASLVNSLDELAPGRAMLTVAPGFLSVEKAGEPQACRQRLGEVVLALRGLLGEGTPRSTVTTWTSITDRPLGRGSSCWPPGRSCLSSPARSPTA